MLPPVPRRIIRWIRARVVDQDVDRPVERAVDVLRVGEVGAFAGDLAEAAGLGGGLFGALCIGAVMHDDSGACLGQADGDRGRSRDRLP